MAKYRDSFIIYLFHLTWTGLCLFQFWALSDFGAIMNAYNSDAIPVSNSTLKNVLISRLLSRNYRKIFYLNTRLCHVFFTKSLSFQTRLDWKKSKKIRNKGDEWTDVKLCCRLVWVAENFLEITLRVPLKVGPLAANWCGVCLIDLKTNMEGYKSRITRGTQTFRGL